MVYEQPNFPEVETSLGQIVKSRKLYPPDGLWVDVVLEWTLKRGDQYITKARIAVGYPWEEVIKVGKTHWIVEAADHADKKGWSLFRSEPKSQRHTTRAISVEYVHRDGTPYDTKALDRALVLSQLTRRS